MRRVKVSEISTASVGWGVEVLSGFRYPCDYTCPHTMSLVKAISIHANLLAPMLKHHGIYDPAATTGEALQDLKEEHFHVPWLYEDFVSTVRPAAGLSAH